MAFQWTWPQSWESIKESMIDSMQTSIRNSMKNKESSSIRGEMVIEDIQFGSDPPTVQLSAINSLNADSACADFFIKYKGDASLKISGIEINLDSCVKDTPFFCPFGMKLCDLHIECGLRITCSREKVPSTSPAGIGQSASWSMSSDENYEGERLTSSAAVYVAQRMSCQRHCCFQQSLFNNGRDEAKAQGTPKKVRRSALPKLVPPAMDMCMRQSRLNLVCIENLAKSDDYNATLATHRFSNHICAETHLFRAIASPTAYSKATRFNCISKSPNSENRTSCPLNDSFYSREIVPKVGSLIDHTQSWGISSAQDAEMIYSSAGWALMEALRKSVTPTACQSAKHSAPPERTVTQIHILFDRNPIQRFTVKSNFGSVEGADDKVVATLRGMLDPIFETFQKEGLTIAI